MVGKAHPNVFEIVESFKKEQAATEVSLAQLAAAPTKPQKSFKKEQAATEVSLAQLAAGAAPPQRRRKVIRRNRMIAELKNRFTSNLVSMEEFVSGTLICDHA